MKIAKSPHGTKLPNFDFGVTAVNSNNPKFRELNKMTWKTCFKVNPSSVSLMKAWINSKIIKTSFKNKKNMQFRGIFRVFGSLWRKLIFNFFVFFLNHAFSRFSSDSRHAFFQGTLFGQNNHAFFRALTIGPTFQSSMEFDIGQIIKHAHCNSAFSGNTSGIWIPF